jgi:hypothetical protein
MNVSFRGQGSERKRGGRKRREKAVERRGREPTAWPCVLDREEERDEERGEVRVKAECRRATYDTEDTARLPDDIETEVLDETTEDDGEDEFGPGRVEDGTRKGGDEDGERLDAGRIAMHVAPCRVREEGSEERDEHTPARTVDGGEGCGADEQDLEIERKRTGEALVLLEQGIGPEDEDGEGERGKRPESEYGKYGEDEREDDGNDAP